ncbi:MAG: class I SAM-dependent methyltransferase [Methanospirillum sp.]|nr:class I SAM-dependent methyltransferase [Methanospirillum sp.]
MTTDNTFNQRRAWDNEYRNKGKLWGKIPLESTTQTKSGIFLDMGCGDGKNLRNASMAASRIGFDFSMQALRLCRTRSELSDVFFVCADARYLPFKNSCIHNIDAHHVLGHLLYHDRIQVVNEITRILKPGGELLVTIFGTEDFRSETGVKIEDGTYLRGNGIITHYFSEMKIQILFPNLILLSTEPCRWFMHVKNQQLPRFVWVLKYAKPQNS